MVALGLRSAGEGRGRDWSGCFAISGEGPDDPFAGAIAAKVDDLTVLLAIEAANGVAETPFGLLVEAGGERIVDSGRPAFFFEGG